MVDRKNYSPGLVLSPQVFLRVLESAFLISGLAAVGAVMVFDGVSREGVPFLVGMLGLVYPACIYYLWRMPSRGVTLESDVLIVRNPLVTKRVERSKVVGVSMGTETLLTGKMYRPLLELADGETISLSGFESKFWPNYENLLAVREIEAWIEAGSEAPS